MLPGGKLPTNALFDIPIVFRLLQFDKAARKSRFPLSWFPST
uniref:Uncharacterized protein n=1 Tax=Leersia perrieri TaxID=77586 RepID=A0A0D9V4G3_9ORYZ